MAFDVIEHTLTAAVADNGTFTVGYPSGRSAGNYLGAHGHIMYALGAKRVAPTNFTVSFGASEATITYKDATTLPSGTVVRIQFDHLSANDGEPEKAIVNNQLRRSPLYVMDLGSPDADDDNGYSASQTVTGVGTAALLNGALVVAGVGTPDVPRNVVAAWTNTAILTITGTDVDGNAVVETTASGTSHTGKKAFKTVTSVTTNATITGATVGSGDVIGLPAYLADTSLILGEMENGVNVVKGTKVYLSDHMLEAAIDAGTSLELVSPVAGNITRVSTVARGTITTGGAITVEVNTVAVDGLSVVVADAAAAGDYDTDVPTAAHASAAVAVGDRIEVIPAAGFNASADIYVIVEITVASASGTALAGVTTAATGTTGDVRGTYNPATDADGATAFALLVTLQDPGNRGVPQYTG